jgi:hypothetical protein
MNGVGQIDAPSKTALTVAIGQEVYRVVLFCVFFAQVLLLGMVPYVGRDPPPPFFLNFASFQF